MAWWSWVACVPPWPDDSVVIDPVVGFMLPDNLDEPGWSEAHDEGRLFVRDRLGLPTGYRDEVPPYDADQALTELIEEGNNVIFAVRYDYASATQQAAIDHPDKLFFNCGGWVTGPNLGSYDARMYQATYLAGRLAAQATCTSRLGVVASIATPEVIRNVNAFTLGAREINPAALVELRFVNQWSDPASEIVAVRGMIEHGVDVFLQLTNGTAVVTEADVSTVLCDDEESPVYSIGYGSTDACGSASDSCLAALTWNWGPLYVNLLGQILDDTIDFRKIRFEPFARDTNTSVIDVWGPGAAVADNSWTELLDKRDDLSLPNNSQQPFVGQLDDINGVRRIQPEQSITDEALAEMCWLVDGVTNGYTGEGNATVPYGCSGSY